LRRISTQSISILLFDPILNELKHLKNDETGRFVLKSGVFQIIQEPCGTILAKTYLPIFGGFLRAHSWKNKDHVINLNITLK